MSDVIEDDDDTDALAAEFVLGTLDADERTHANLLLDIDDDFRGKVRTWERRLGELHLMVEPVDPPPPVWDRIRGKIEEAGVRPAALAAAPQAAAEAEKEPDAAAPEEAGSNEPASGSTLETTLDALEAELRKVGLPDHTEETETAERAPELIAERAAPEVERPSAETAERTPEAIARDRRAVATRDRPSPYLASEPEEMLVPALRRWRAAAVMMMVLVLAVGGLITAWRYFPDRLPQQLRPTTLLNIAVAPAGPMKPKAPPESVFDE